VEAGPPLTSPHLASIHQSIRDILVEVEHADLGEVQGIEPPLPSDGFHEILGAERRRLVERVVK